MIDLVLQDALDKIWDDLRQHRAAQLQARIGVDFDQPRSQTAIDHEVKAKDLEVILQPFLVQVASTCPYYVSPHFLRLIKLTFSCG